MDKRLELHDWLMLQLGCPYVWSAKGGQYADVSPKVKMVAAYDCSGLVTAGIHAVGGPDWRMTHGSARLFTELAPTEEPQPYDLVFYGTPQHIMHVMFHWGDGRVYGACGGNSSTFNVATARRIGARVQFKATARYRPDLVGARKLPPPFL